MKLLLVAFGTVLAVIVAFLVGLFSGVPGAIFVGFCSGPLAFVFLGWALHAANLRVVVASRARVESDPAPMMTVKPRRSRLQVNGSER